MPKMRKRINKGRTVKKENVNRKYRIGNRSGGRSALQMSTQELIGVLSKDNMKKYHANAVAVLKTRPIRL